MRETKKDRSEAVAAGVNSLRVFEAFSGIGAQNAALRDLGINYEIVGTSDWFVNAILAYDAIHTSSGTEVVVPEYEKQVEHLGKFTFSIDSQRPLKNIRQLGPETIRKLYVAQQRTKNFGSITDIKAKDLPDIDLLIYSFPCQDLSTGGNGNGMAKDSGTRSCLIWHIARLLTTLKTQNRLPKYLLMENVPAILFPRYKADFQKWRNRLSSLGYRSDKPFVLDATEFGIPQDRNRMFMVSHLGSRLDVANRIVRTPWNGDIHDFLRMNYDNPVFKEEADEASLNLTPSRQVMWRKNKREEPFDAETIIHPITCNMDRTNTAALFSYGEKIRRLTIREAFLLMGFTEADYNRVKALGFTYRQRNKLIGNAIVVPVLKAIFSAMFAGSDFMPREDR